MLTDTGDHPMTSVAGLETNTLADGFFHLAAAGSPAQAADHLGLAAGADDVRRAGEPVGDRVQRRGGEERGGSVEVMQALDALDKQPSRRHQMCPASPIRSPLANGTRAPWMQTPGGAIAWTIDPDWPRETDAPFHARGCHRRIGV